MQRLAFSTPSTSRPALALALASLACGPRPKAPQPADEPPPQAAEGAPDEPSADVRGPAPFPFRARFELPTEGLPEGVWIGDLDGDGEAELLALTKTPARLHLWGGLAAKARRIEVPDYPLGPRVVELGGRGWVALASRATRELLLLDPLLAEPMASALRFELPGTPRAFTSGDLDADGSPDLICALLEGRLVWIGRGGERRELELLDAQPRCLALLPGMVIVGSQSEACLRAYRLSDAGWQADPARLALGGIPRALTVVQGEAGPLLAVAGGQHELWWIGASEAGSNWLDPARPCLRELRVQPLDSHAGAIPIALTTLGKAEGPPRLLRLDHGAQSFELLEASAGRLHSLGGPHYAGQDPWSVAAGDLDGDGLSDLAIACRGASRISVVLAASESTFECGLSLPVGRGPHSIACADLFGDARPEVGVIGALSGTIELWEAAPDGYSLRTSLDARPAGAALCAGDLDRDGQADLALLVRDDAGSRLRLYFGDGAAGFEAGAAEAGAGTHASDLLAADLDGDGRLELVASDVGAGRVRWWRIEGRELRLGGELAVPSAPTALCLFEPAHESAGRELRGATLAVALGEPGPRTGFAILGWRDDGLRELAYQASDGYALDIVAAQLDGGGARELCLLVKPGQGDGPGRLRIFAPRAEPASAEPASAWRLLDERVTGQRPYALAAGDFDADGRDDLIVGAQNNHHVNLWHAGPRGLERLADVGVGRGVLDVLFSDLNADGRDDVLAANSFSNDLSILFARGGARGRTPNSSGRSAAPR